MYCTPFSDNTSPAHYLATIPPTHPHFSNAPPSTHLSVTVYSTHFSATPLLPPAFQWLPTPPTFQQHPSPHPSFSDNISPTHTHLSATVVEWRQATSGPSRTEQWQDRSTSSSSSAPFPPHSDKGWISQPFFHCSRIQRRTYHYKDMVDRNEVKDGW